MKRIFNSVIVIGIVLCCGNASAFDPEMHFKYTFRASQALGSCKGDPIDPWLVGKFAAGTDKEDTTDPLNRIENWHYAPNNRLPKESVLLFPLPVIGYATMAHVFATRSRELRDVINQEDCKSGEVFSRAGHVLHFLQDVRVPSHVIPVHHGSVFGKDGFDGYDFDFSASEGGDVCGQDVEAKRLVGLATTGSGEGFVQALEELREHIGRETAEMMNQELGDTGCMARQIFWCDPAIGEQCGSWPMPGFGRYRKYPKGMKQAGKTIDFGADEVACNGKAVQISRAEYLAYFRESYRKMMRNSALMQRFAQLASLKNKCDSGGP
jgi:hypothetical protein